MGWLTGSIGWVFARIIAPFVWIGEGFLYLVRPKTQQGRIYRQILSVFILVFVSITYIYPTPVNRVIEIKNSWLTSLSQWESLPFRQNGFDQWLSQVNVPSVPEHQFILGLDLQGGVRVIYDVDLSQISDSEQQNALDSLRQIINTRVNALGVSEPQIYFERGDTTRLVVELAGLNDPEQAIALIGATPQLAFYQGRAQAETEEIITKLTNGDTSETRNPYFVDPAILTGQNLDRAEVVFDPQTGQPQVSIRFDADGRKIFADFTRDNIGEILYIVLDGQIVSAPSINQEIPSGEAVISGSFTREQAKALVDYLNSGALPVPISINSQQTIQASLGADALQQSLRASVVGFIVVSIYMIIWYRLLGVIAVIALAIYSVLGLTLFSVLGFTLTLAGITGFVVSIGLAVDGNILIFERMKEELRDGHTFQASVKEGIRRAWESIRDSQISTLISAVILFYLASGVVQGFGVTLIIGIIISLFTSIVVTRILLSVLGFQERFLSSKIGKWLTLQ